MRSFARYKYTEQGFTLVELLVVLAIVAILGALGITAFRVYQANAAYSVASDTMRNARTAFEAGITNLDTPPASFGLTLQTAQGTISDANARSVLPGMTLPKNVSFRVSYDADCLAANCQSAFIQVNHCQGSEYIQWIRFGDGMGILLEKLSGKGCG